MIEAYRKAQETFKYFWRELSWEHRRIIPALNLACVKTPFSETDSETGKSIVEHMWIDDIDFNGDTVTGFLMNNPNELTGIQAGDYFEIPLNKISDWLFAITPAVKNKKGLSKWFSSSEEPIPKTYGGFTIHKMRADMATEAERDEHDQIWGLDFKDFNDIEIVHEQKENPENLTEHPMSRNIKEEFGKFIKEYPNELTQQDENGYTLLHQETIAGNRVPVEVLLEAGADRHLKTHTGKTALDFAKQLHWKNLIPLLEN